MNIYFYICTFECHVLGRSLRKNWIVCMLCVLSLLHNEALKILEPIGYQNIY